MIISNSNAAKAKQKMGSYSHRGTRASGGGIPESYFTKYVRFNVGDAVPEYVYFSNNIKGLIILFDPEVQQPPPGTETILATATGSGASEGVTFDVVAKWDAEPSPDPEYPWGNYTCDIRIILRRDETTLTMMISPFSNVGKISTLNFNGSFNYVNELFDVLFTKQPIYYGVDSLKFENAKSTECVLEADKEYGPGAVHFSNSFYSIFAQDKAERLAFIDAVFECGDQVPMDDEEVDLIEFDIENSEPKCLRMHITSYEDAFFYIYIYTGLFVSENNIGGCIEEGGYVVGIRDISFNDFPFTASIINNCFWNMNDGTITVLQHDLPFDTDVWYAPAITGVSGTIDANMVNKDIADLLEGAGSSIVVGDCTIKRMFFLVVNTTQLDPQYGIPSLYATLQQTSMALHTGSVDRIFSAYDAVGQVESVFKITFEDGSAAITEVTMGGTTVPLSILDNLIWRVMVITSKQGELMVPSET